MTEITHKTPKFSELVRQMKDIDEGKAVDDNSLNYLLASKPYDAWVKKHPIVKVKNSKGESVPEEYIPSNIKRWLLRFIFGEYWDEIVREGSMFNSCYCVVRINYWNPFKKEYCRVEGVGAVAVQTDAGATAADLKSIKSDGVMKALPAAAEYAFNNACKKLGTIFGGDLNKNTITPGFIPYTGLIPDADPRPHDTDGKIPFVNAMTLEPQQGPKEDTINF